VKGKDGKLYVLDFDGVDWNVLRVFKPDPKKYVAKGGLTFEGDKGTIDCFFRNYRTAWLYFLDCLAGKEPNCDTWKPPKPKKK